MKIIILDRDGVINQEFPGEYILDKTQFIPIANSLEAIARLKKAGYTVIVATNQSILAKRMINFDHLQQIHNKLQNLLSIYDAQIDQFFVCPHQEIDDCECRKPKPGMLLQIAEKYKFNFNEVKVYFIGDSLTDLLAAKSSGAIPVLVKTGKGSQTINQKSINNIENLLIFEDLYNFVNYLLNIQL